MKNKILIFSLIGIVIILSLASLFLFKISSTDSSYDNSHDFLMRENNATSDQKTNDISKNKTKTATNKSDLTPQSETTPQNISDTKATDQTSHKPKAESTQNQSTPTVLSTHGFESIIEITLLDSLDDKPLQNLALTLKIKTDKDERETLHLNTNAEGKISFTLTRAWAIDIKIITEKYAVHSERFTIAVGKNNRVAKLFNGGTIEVKITTPDNRPLNTLMARIYVTMHFQIEHEILRELQLDDLPMGYNQVKNTFSLKLPQGRTKIVFYSPNYLETTPYEILIQPETTTSIEVSLAHKRTIYFDVDITPKPNALYVAVKESDVFRANNHTPVKIQQNDKNLYEYELTTEMAPELTIFAEGYFIEEITLHSDQDIYKLSFTPSFVGTLYLKNPKGEAIEGVSVGYWVDRLRILLTSDKDGVVKITGIPKTTRIYFSIEHPDYILSDRTDTSWEFDAEKTNTKELKLIHKLAITGKIFHNEKPVPNALLLFGKDEWLSSTQTYSTHDGSYFVNQFAINGILSTEKIWAFHPDFGIATVTLTALGGNQRTIDLHLQEQLNALIRLVDENDKPLSHKSITISHFYLAFSITVITDENGEVQLKNLLPGTYSIKLNDTHISLQESITQTKKVLSGIFVLKANSNSMASIKVLTPEGTPFNGIFEVFLGIELNHQLEYPLYVERGDNGVYHVQLQNSRKFLGPYSLIFKAQVYAPVSKDMGAQGAEALILQNGLTLNLQTGQEINLEIVDDLDGSPIRNAIVTASFDFHAVRYTTNHLGEVCLSNLGQNISIHIEKNGYCAEQIHIDDTQLKKKTIRLKQSGGLKGHVSFKSQTDDLGYYDILLSHQNQEGGVAHQERIDAKGNFKISNICTGTYTLALQKDGKQTFPLPDLAQIESGKITEIEIDFQINTTPLGTLYLSIYDRHKNILIERNLFMFTSDQGASQNRMSEVGSYYLTNITPGQHTFYWQGFNKNNSIIRGTITILPELNTLDLYIPEAQLTISVKNEKSEPLKNIITTLHTGKILNQGFNNTQSVATKESGTSAYSNLMPKTPYYVVIEEDLKTNYQIGTIGPITLEAGQNPHIDYILPDGRNIPKIQIVDKNNKPIAGASFITKTGEAFLQRTSKKEWSVYPHSDQEGFLPANGWPKESFILRVGKENYACREILIGADFASSQLIQIQLSSASSIQVNFIENLPLQISVGILDHNGNLIQSPAPLKTYFNNITSGKVTFSNLDKGTYFIGYYWNNSDALISRQGPIQIGTSESTTINSNLVITNQK